MFDGLVQVRRWYGRRRSATNHQTVGLHLLPYILRVFDDHDRSHRWFCCVPIRVRNGHGDRRSSCCQPVQRSQHLRMDRLGLFRCCAGTGFDLGIHRKSAQGQNTAGTNHIILRAFTPRSRPAGSPRLSLGTTTSSGDLHTSGSGSSSLLFSRFFPVSCGRRTCTVSVRQTWTRSATSTSTSLITTSRRIGPMATSRSGRPSSAS